MVIVNETGEKRKCLKRIKFLFLKLSNKNYSDNLNKKRN